jgi:hypothetical protein
MLDIQIINVRSTLKIFYHPSRLNASPESFLKITFIINKISEQALSPVQTNLANISKTGFPDS